MYVNDNMEGKGVYTWPSGDKYEGDYVDDQKEGEGTYYYINDLFPSLQAN